jgi:hypothetical protein
MNNIGIPGANMDLAEHQDEYQTLPVKAGSVTVTCHDGDVSDVPCFISAWRPTRTELALLLDGGYIELCVLGTNHPPVMLNVSPEDSKVPANV